MFLAGDSLVRDRIVVDGPRSSVAVQCFKRGTGKPYGFDQHCDMERPPPTDSLRLFCLESCRELAVHVRRVTQFAATNSNESGLRGGPVPFAVLVVDKQCR